jgi:hypothetical protein
MVGAMNKGEQSLERLLEKLLKETEGKDLSLQRIADLLGDTGQAILLVLFSFPFCQPLQIPGFSTPFGIIISLIGIRMTFGGKLWMPQFIGKKKISYHNLEKIVHLTIKAVKKLHFLLAARLDYLVQNPCFHCLNGALIASFSIAITHSFNESSICLSSFSLWVRHSMEGWPFYFNRLFLMHCFCGGINCSCFIR